MWFYGSAKIPRAERFDLKGVRKNAIWHKALTPYGPPLLVDPWSFIYAATRASILGRKIGLRGQIAGSGLSLAAMCYLTPYPPKLAWGPPWGSLFLHDNFSYAKDFVGSSLKGTIGAALSYLEMQALGYGWVGHWEDCAAGAMTGPYPDFVFAANNKVCLVDAKGSASEPDDVGAKAKSEWKRQIFPHRSSKMKLGGFPSEGRVISTALSFERAAHLITAHGYLTPSLPSTSKAAVRPAQSAEELRQAIRSVQLANYIDACYLLGLNQMALALIQSTLVDRRASTDSALHSALERSEDIDDQGPVVLGPPRLWLDSGDASRIMRPFVRLSVLREVLDVFVRQTSESAIPGVEFIVPDSTFSNRHEGLEQSSPLIVQGRDGVGAVFRRVS